MDRLVVLVDAGYLLSQAVKILSNKQTRSRAELQLKDAPGLIAMLVDKAKTELQNQSLLRVYWYDGVKGGLSAEHKAIVAVDDVQLRSGTINSSGQQKGVDSKIVIDLIELATNQAISDAMIVTGDGDLAIGIELSQRRGVRVAVLGVEDPSIGVVHAQSPEVTDVADRVIHISSADLSPYLTYVPKVAAPSPQQQGAVNPSVASPSSSSTGTAATVSVATHSAASVQALQQADIALLVSQFVSSQNPALDPAKVLTQQGGIVPSTDRELMYFVFSALGRKLLESEKRQARSELRACLGANSQQP